MRSAALLLVPLFATGCAMWEGGYPTAEFRLNVKDAHGTPVAGTELVVRKNGVVSYDYPIDDFNRSTVLRSDANGAIVFHHLGTGIEFGGTCGAGFVGTCSDPVDTLDIVDHGVVRASLPLGSLYPANTDVGVGAWAKLPKVTARVLVPLSRAWYVLEDRPSSPRSRELWAMFDRASRDHDDYTLLTVFPKDMQMTQLQRDVVLR